MTYIVAEIGQNHNGSVDIAKVIIDLVARPAIDGLFGRQLAPVNAIKLTKRDLSHELARSQSCKPYISPHSFGATYGEHRARLELSDDQHFELFKYAKSLGFDLIETLCSPRCLSLLALFRPDYLKVASRDLTNLPLLKELAATGIPIILSTGMGAVAELDAALAEITRYHKNVSILHCVSQYPADPINVNLKTIHFLKKRYADFRIGYSDHTIGISAAVAAVAMGAEIVEKHVTLDRGMKGSDHACSLGPEGIQRMVRDIRLLELAMGTEQMLVPEAVRETRDKLQRSIATNRPLVKGCVLQESDLHMLSPGDGFTWADRSQVIGRILQHDIGENEIIYAKHIGLE